MKELPGDIWTIRFPDGSKPDCIVIPVNMTVKKDGRAVMGTGIAKQLVLRYPMEKYDAMYGEFLQNVRGGESRSLVLNNAGPNLYALPVKHNWWEKADLELIKVELKQLIQDTKDWEWKRIVLPRLGCGAGKLLWKDVKPVMAKLLDNRFTVVFGGPK